MNKLVFKVPHKKEIEGDHIGLKTTKKDTTTNHKLVSILPADGSETTKYRESRAPIKPKSSFSMFVADNRKMLIKKGLTTSEASSEASKMWQDASPDEKKAYDDILQKGYKLWQKQLMHIHTCVCILYQIKYTYCYKCTSYMYHKS